MEPLGKIVNDSVGSFFLDEAEDVEFLFEEGESGSEVEVGEVGDQFPKLAVLSEELFS